MLKKCYRLAITSILIISFVFTSVGFTQDGSSKSKKLNQINNTIKNVQAQLIENKKKEKDVSSQIQVLSGKINQTEKEIGEINREVTITQGKINRIKNDLFEAEKNIEEKNDVMNGRLRAMYMNGSVGYAEVLFDSANIVELFSKIDMVKKIIDHDQKLLKDLKDQRNSINQKKKVLESHESDMVAMMSNMKVKQQQLAQSRGEMSRIKQKINQDNKQLENQIDSLNDYAEKISDSIRQKTSTGTTYSGGKLAWPAPGYSRITSPFGYRIHPILHTKKMHTGIDIGVPSGNSIVAAGDGRVIHSGWLGGYGKAVMIDHGGGIVTLYAHNSSLLVSDGSSVKRGQVIAKSGSTGMSSGPHLHFEVRQNGSYVNPIPWVR